MSLALAWWAFPMAITGCAFAWAALASAPSDRPSYADGVLMIFAYGVALILSLIAWLIWAVMT